MKISAIAAAAFTIAAMGSSFVGPSFVTPSFAAGGGPAGEWAVEDHSAVVRIAKCGAGFCGFVASGQGGKDYRNPDPRKRNRSLIGIEVMFNMRPSGANSWSGQTYNADDGQMYSAKITVTSPGALQVEGCSPGGVCGSQTWSRVR